MITYQALLSRPDFVARAKEAKRAIERAGGSIRIEPPASNGMVVVLLRLPEIYVPDQFVPGLPFYAE